MKLEIKEGETGNIFGRNTNSFRRLVVQAGKTSLLCVLCAVRKKATWIDKREYYSQKLLGKCFINRPKYNNLYRSLSVSHAE